MIPLFITLGSNIEPERHIVEAVKLLREQLTITAVSRVYRTAAVGADGQASGQEDFLNAAVLAEYDGTTPPIDIKYKVLRPIEEALGRMRTDDKFAARTIDLDIALFGELVVQSAEITLPDPDIVMRTHVALPLADLDPTFMHPITGETLGEIADRLRANTDISPTNLSLTI